MGVYVQTGASSGSGNSIRFVGLASDSAEAWVLSLGVNIRLGGALILSVSDSDSVSDSLNGRESRRGDGKASTDEAELAKECSPTKAKS